MNYMTKNVLSCVNCLNDVKNLKKLFCRDLWVAELVEYPTLGFGSGCDLGVVG